MSLVRHHAKVMSSFFLLCFDVNSCSPSACTKQSDEAAHGVEGWELQQRDAAHHTGLGGPVTSTASPVASYIPKQKEGPYEINSNTLQ